MNVTSDLARTLEVAQRVGQDDPVIADYGVAIAVAHSYLIASGVPAKLDQQRVSALATELKKESWTAKSVAEVLRSWAV